MSKQKDNMDLVDEMIDFLRKSPTKYHFVSSATRLLKKNKFQELELIEGEKLNIPKKGFLIINRSMIIAFELGSTDKSVIITSSIDGKVIKIDDSDNTDENGIIQCKIDTEGESAECESELFNAYEYRLAGEILIEKNSASRQYLFESDKPIGIVENNLAILSLPDTSIQSYLEFTHSIPYQKLNLIEKNLYLIPNSQTPDNILIGPSKSIINLSNLSSYGASFMALKAFLSSAGKGSYNKFIAIIPNEAAVTSSSIISHVNLILSSKKTSVNEESLIFNIGGVESLWASHFPCSINTKYLSKGIVIQNCHQNKVILDKLAVFGIPTIFADDQQIEYSLNQDQLLIVNEVLPIKISLPMFNHKTLHETASVSDIYNFYNSLYEICLI